MKEITLIKEYQEKITVVKKGISKNLKGVKTSDFCKKLKALGYAPVAYQFSAGEDINETFDILDNKIGIYVFIEETPSLTKDKWNKFKKECPEKEGKDGKMYTRKFPAWNTKRKNEINNLFYLGKSENLKKRLLEHTDDPSASTYALRLSLFKEKFDYSIYVFYNDDESLNFELVNSIVESTLHEELKPKIGSCRS